MGLQYLMCNSLSLFVTAWEHISMQTLLGETYKDFYLIASDVISLLVVTACAIRLPTYLCCDVTFRYPDPIRPSPPPSFPRQSSGVTAQVSKVHLTASSPGSDSVAERQIVGRTRFSNGDEPTKTSSEATAREPCSGFVDSDC